MHNVGKDLSLGQIRQYTLNTNSTAKSVLEFSNYCAVPWWASEVGTTTGKFIGISGPIHKAENLHTALSTLYTT